MKKKYCIKNNYVSRSSYFHWDDTNSKDEYQDEVYETAYRISKQNDLSKILDIGCGSGYKLLKYFRNLEFLGTEIEPTLSWLKNNYPEHIWEQSDLSRAIEDKYDILICSDVIEHLTNPDDLIDYIERIDFKYAVLSTPERESIQMYQRGYNWDGPPNNPAHIREWNFSEFRNYISQKFNIIEHFMSQNEAESKPLCQIVVATKK